MKNLIRYILQKILGFDNYLFLFSVFSVKSLKYNRSEDEFVYFIKIIPNEGLILDIGANIGITTIPLARGKNNATVYSFEPMPENIAALKRVVSFFKVKNVRIFETALGEEPATLKMVMPIINNVKMQGLSYVVTGDAEINESIDHVITVPVQKLDDIEELKSSDRITAIKIDVENFEYFVLKGGEALLIKHKPLIYCELWGNEKKAMTINYLESLGYTMKIYDKDTLIDPVDSDCVNFFFIP